MANTIPILLVLSCIFLLGSSRLRVSIRMVAVQGLLLGVLPLLQGDALLRQEMWLFSLGSIAVKGIALPWLLLYVLQKMNIRREIEPLISFSASILIGIVLLGLSCWVALSPRLASGEISPVTLTAALYLVMTGLFLIVSRRKAITQTLGYLVMENGIYTIGVGIGNEFPFIVEMGVLLDVFVGIFLMGIMMFHIDREFDHIDTDRFTELSDRITTYESPAEWKEMKS